MDPRSSVNPPRPSEAAAAAARPAVEGFALGAYETNCYIVRRPRRSGCWIVDAGYEPEELIRHVQKEGLKPEMVVLTHAHPDHIAGLGEVLEAFPGVPVAIHEAEREWLGNPRLNLSVYLGQAITVPGPDRTLKEGDQLELEGLRWEVRHTPGHSPGSISLYWKASEETGPDVAIVGDALFAGSIGRTDFPGCSAEVLTDSIRRRLYTLPDDTVIYPGHGPGSTIGREKRTNPFVKG